MSRRIDVYFSLISPWACLGHRPFLDVAARYGVEIGWYPVPLGGLFAETGGLPLAKRSIERQRYRFIELERWSARRGRPLVLRPKHWPFDPSAADRAAIALVLRGEDPSAYLTAGFRAAWEEERDLASIETIGDLLARTGFDAAAVVAESETQRVLEAYQSNRDRAQAASAFGSPTYVLDGEPFWGQDRLDMLDDALASGRPPYVADF